MQSHFTHYSTGSPLKRGHLFSTQVQRQTRLYHSTSLTKNWPDMYKHLPWAYPYIKGLPLAPLGSCCHLLCIKSNLSNHPSVSPPFHDTDFFISYRITRSLYKIVSLPNQIYLMGFANLVVPPMECLRSFTHDNIQFLTPVKAITKKFSNLSKNSVPSMQAQTQD